MIINYIKTRKRRNDEFQFFMHDFIDECIKYGFKPLKDFLPYYRIHIRAICRDILLYIYKFIHSFFPFLITRKKGNLLITANGVSIKDSLFPYYSGYNIIPVLWDCWPDQWETMIKDFKLFDIHYAFVTSSQVAKKINNETNIHATWIPEGIKMSLYDKGKSLTDRAIDVMNMGRRMQKYDKVLSNLKEKGIIKQIITSNINKNGNLNDKHVAYSNDQLHKMMSNSKIMVCFPRCDTNPEVAGNIETLTQRYWEAMLSRCVIIGRAPKELIDLINYNPVIEVDWENSEEQLVEILSNISNYQKLVDQNFLIAKEKADWSKRMCFIIDKINK